MKKIEHFIKRWHFEVIWCKILNGTCESKLSSVDSKRIQDIIWLVFARFDHMGCLRLVICGGILEGKETENEVMI